jgi:Ca2+-binding EF-hand superfamily protein
MDEDVLLSEKNLQTAFNIFDLDGDHTISISEIKTLLSYGSNLNSDEAI